MSELLPILLGALLIFGLRVVGAAVGAAREILMTRGMEGWTAAMGFVEVLTYVLAIGVVMKDLTNVPNIVAYCAGFSAGTVVGMRIEARLALGYVTVRAFSATKGQEVATALRDAGFGATLTWGEGMSGPVAEVQTVVTRRAAGEATGIVASADEEAFVISDDTRGPSVRRVMRQAPLEAAPLAAAQLATAVSEDLAEGAPTA